MTDRGAPAATALRLPPAHLDAVWRVMVAELVCRSIPFRDADDAAWDVLNQILRDPDAYGEALTALDEEPSFFVREALKAHRDQLLAERRRRQRLRRYMKGVDGPSAPTPTTIRAAARQLWAVIGRSARRRWRATLRSTGTSHDDT